MSAELAPYLGAAVVIIVVAVTWAARIAPSASTTGTAPFTDTEPGVRYLRCDELACAHMTYPHRPQDGGSWVCANCGTSKGGAA